MKRLTQSILLGAVALGTIAGAWTATPALAAQKPVHVVIQTSKGNIELELYPEKAPLTVKNFVGYAKKGFYNGTIFHRVISGFMIQGGGFTQDMHQKSTGAPIKNEGKNGLKNTRGSIAMARTGNPDSATAQFFINVVDNPNLDYPRPDHYGYAVFGKVTKGMDVVDKIRNTPTGMANTPMGPMPDVPKTAVVIKAVAVK